jgi:hypothetical protein
MNIDFIASRFHAALAGGHLFALWFNLKRKNRVDAAIHAAFLLYDGASAIRHHKQSKEQTNGRRQEHFTG